MEDDFEDEIAYPDDEGGGKSKSVFKGKLARKYGPLSLGAWILVIIAGLILAWLIRRMWGTSSTAPAASADDGEGWIPQPVGTVEPVDALQPSYMEIMLQWPDTALAIEQAPLEINIPEGLSLFTPTGISVAMPGMETGMEGLVNAANAQTQALNVAALRAQETKLITQIAALTVRIKAAPLGSATRKTLTANRVTLRARLKSVRAAIKAARGVTTAGADFAAATPEAGGPGYNPF